MKASCEMRASPYEHEEMEFLSTLCEKIRQDSSIILLYIQVRLLFLYSFENLLVIIFSSFLLFFILFLEVSPLCFL